MHAGKEAQILICLSFAGTPASGVGEGVFSHVDAIEFMFWALMQHDTTIVGHYVHFDMVSLAANAGPRAEEMLKLMFRAYQAGRIQCTTLREQLIHLGTTPGLKKKAWDLATLTRRHGLTGDRSASKGPDAWRMKYHLLRGVPVHQYPPDAYLYALEDATSTLALYLFQQEHGAGFLADAARQAHYAFSFQLLRVWGIRTNADKVAALEHRAQTALGEVDAILMSHGLRRDQDRPDPITGKNVTARQHNTGVKAKYAELFLRCYAAVGEDAPRNKVTEKARAKGETLGNLNMDKLKWIALGAHVDHGDTLDCECDLCVARHIGDVSKWRYLLNNVMGVLKSGTKFPAHPRYNTLLETGRVSTSPQMLGFGRDGLARACFEPRPGYCFGQSDYTGQELSIQAQILVWLFGESVLATAIQNDQDLHCVFVAQYMGLPYAEVYARYKAGDPEIVECRQNSAKAANFGFWGGMAWRGFAHSERQKGNACSDAQAKKSRRVWLETWTPDAHRFFNLAKGKTRNSDRACTYEQWGSGRIRYKCRYTQWCNTGFQGLASDVSKTALTMVSYECYCVPESPLYRCRPVLFIHDELMLEFPLDLDLDAAHRRLCELMVEAHNRWCPDVPVKAEGALMSVWSKGAKAVFDAAGKLTVWRP